MTIANNEAVWMSKDGSIKVVRAGYQDGVELYAVVRNGLVQYPWMQKRQCIRDAKSQASE